MTTKRCEITHSKDCQDSHVGFAGRKNLILSRLETLLGLESGKVYSYVAPTATFQSGTLLQKGSGLNFEGACITLCTCKHKMRTYLDVRAGTWIAAFASGVNSQQHQLFALMKIEQTFESHAEMWNALPPSLQQRKSAASNQFGDIYQPRSKVTHDAWLVDSYHALHSLHPHRGRPEAVEKDINYHNAQTGRFAKLLLGDKKHNYLWTQPFVAYKGQHPRAKKWDSITKFLSQLEVCDDQDH